MKDFFRIQLILLPEVEIEKKLKLFRSRERDQGKGILFPDLLNGQKDLEFRKLLNELLRIP